MLRQFWKPIATTVAIGTPGVAYLYYRNRQETFELPFKSKGPDGKPQMSSRTLPLLPLQTVEARISEHATSQSVPRPGGIVWNYTTACLASNDPIEDAHADQIVQKENSTSNPGDYLFFAVMDGHSGPHTSQLLSRVLIKAVALELASLVADPNESIPKAGLMGRVQSTLWGGSPATQARHMLDADPESVSAAIANAFTKLDKELLNAPLQVLAINIDEDSRKNKTIPDLSEHPLALPTMLPAISGSCALMAVLDTAHKDLYVACTGDSRAVAGVWEQTGPDGEGVWKVEVLSQDQTGRNPDEAKRIKSEHPKDEADYVVRAGRILGGLEPSRAFGDARYKWPRAVQETLSEAFLIGNGKPMRPPPNSFKTPPYVTATPVVTHRKLSFLPLTNSPPEKAIRFIVLATDGLWDELSSEDVVRLVGGHLAGLKGKIPKSTLASLVPTSSGSPTIEGKDKNRRTADDGSWAFSDKNVSAHLIRNAFGGGDNDYLRKLLSIPAPYSRRHRDDVTVTVVWWEDGREEGARISSFADNVKSKL